jgi:hypothetical protein
MVRLSLGTAILAGLTVLVGCVEAPGTSFDESALATNQERIDFFQQLLPVRIPQTVTEVHFEFVEWMDYNFHGSFRLPSVEEAERFHDELKTVDPSGKAFFKAQLSGTEKRYCVVMVNIPEKKVEVYSRNDDPYVEWPGK